MIFRHNASLGRGLCCVIVLLLYVKICGAQTSQSIEITIKQDKVTLSRILDEFEKLTSLTCVYNTNEIPLNKTVSVDIKKETTQGALKEILEQLELEAKIIAHYVIISKVNSQFKQPPIAISGVITDENSIPLTGANIYIKGTTLGITSDINGFYSLELSEIPDSICYSLIGYKSQTIKYQKLRKEYHIQLQTKCQDIGEVMIVGFDTQKKISQIGAISTTDITKLKTSSANFSNSLGGRLAGLLSIQRSGEPGYDAASFWIRGISTLADSKSPLTLVDGIERPIDDLNYEELASLSILKDATATAVYGVRGANGVIMATTRKGKKGPALISIKSEVGITGSTRLPDYVDSPTYAELYNEAKVMRDAKPYYSQADIELYRSGADPDLYPNVDWIDELIKPWNSMQRINMNASGGKKHFTYFVNTSYYHEDGIYKTQKEGGYNTNINHQKYTLRSNLTFDISDDQKIELGLAGVLIDTHFPRASAKSIFGNILQATPNAFPIRYSTGHIAGPEAGAVPNPYEKITQSGYLDEWKTKYHTNIKYEFEPKKLLQGLKLSAMVGFDNSNMYVNFYSQKASTWIVESRDSFGDLVLRQTQFGDDYLSYSKQSSGSKSQYVEAKIKYNTSVDLHNISVLILYNQSRYDNPTASNAITAFPNKNNGFAGRLTYNFKSTYFTEFNFGYNGSENFTKKNRYGFFPSIALGWIVTNYEPIKLAIPFLQQLKLKASYGHVGNDKIGNRRFVYQTTMNDNTNGYRFGNDYHEYKGVSEDQWGTEDASWETAKKTNYGFEMQVFQNLFFEIDAFKERREDIFIERRSLPSYVGIAKKPWNNIGVVKTKGYDLTLRYGNEIGDCRFNIIGTVTNSSNKIVDNDSPTPKYSYQSSKGFPIDQQRGLVALGLFKDSLEIVGSPKQTFGEVRPGDIKYKDINNDGVIDSYDILPIGKTKNPETIYGLGINIQYKSIDFSAFLQGVTDATIIIGGLGVYPFLEGGQKGNVLTQVTDRWTPENNSSNVFFPRLSTGDHQNNYQASTWWQKDASFLRLKNIEFGYSLPRHLTSKLRLQNLRLYLSAVNLFILDKFDLWDPEIGSSNGSGYPPQRSITLGIEIKI